MGTICNCAEYVLVWLGNNETPHIDSLVDHVFNLAKEYDMFNNNWPDIPDDEISYVADCFGAIFARPFFQRI